MNINNNLSNTKFIKMPDDMNIREPLSPLSSIDQTLEEDRNHMSCLPDNNLASVLQSSYGMAKKKGYSLQQNVTLNILLWLALHTGICYELVMDLGRGMTVTPTNLDI